MFVFCLSCYLAFAGYSALSEMSRDLRENQPIFIIFGCCSFGVAIILPAAFTLGVSIFLFRTVSRRWRYGRQSGTFALTALAHSALVIAAWTVFSGTGSLLSADWPHVIAHLLSLVLIPAIAPLWLLRATPAAP